jgi:hypothetical protein
MSVRHLHQADLARRWNVSPRTLERWRWLRKGPPYLKIGGRVAYRLCDVEAFEAAHIRTISGSTGERRPAA